jgi:DNA-binding LytR/AlgR family response regulator
VSSEGGGALHALVVEDEPLAAAHLLQLLAADGRFVVVQHASGLAMARALLASHTWHVVFLDVTLSDGSGLELVPELPAGTRLILTTASDRHALLAFELAAVDYLLKPFGAARLAQAIGRLGLESVEQVQRITAPGMLHDGHLERFFARVGDRAVPIHAAEIVWMEARGDYVRVHVGTRALLVAVSLTALLERLDPALFIRVHRSAAVNLAHVSALRSDGDGRFVAQMSTGALVPASRTHSRELRRRVF